MDAAQPGELSGSFDCGGSVAEVFGLPPQRTLLC